MIIRDESLADRPHIALLLDQAFGGTYESRLVARLRQAGFVAVALVAEEGGQLVGHIVMSRLPAQLDGRSVRALALAPMAVRPDRQRRGAGSRLLTAALERARASDADAIFVLGHPAYYSRFGFSARLAAKIAAPFAGPNFMALELVPGALTGVAGAVAYPAAFDRG
jgi:putative acetyltransferase